MPSSPPLFWHSEAVPISPIGLWTSPSLLHTSTVFPQMSKCCFFCFVPKAPFSHRLSGSLGLLPGIFSPENAITSCCCSHHRGMLFHAIFVMCQLFFSLHILSSIAQPYRHQSACPNCTAIVSTGHSLGAALAGLFILDIGILQFTTM